MVTIQKSGAQRLFDRPVQAAYQEQVHLTVREILASNPDITLERFPNINILSGKHISSKSFYRSLDMPGQI
jgi:hypothetical protein